MAGDHMKPVAIFRFFLIEEPGYFATFLDNNHIPWQLIRVDAGDPLPADVNSFSGLVLMGGPMSVNDDLPWIAPILALIRQAVDKNLPVLGHCLGGQLMSKAFGGVIDANPIKEIGWGEVSVVDHAIAKKWFSHLTEFESFHWHGETFSIPDGATRILSNQNCQNQAFAKGIHLAMQCHIEMTVELVNIWCKINNEEIAKSLCPSVQSAEEMKANLTARITRLNHVADILYPKWIAGLKC
jgi:GMP synthase-like glutamine amidotransferase